VKGENYLADIINIFTTIYNIHDKEILKIIFKKIN